jgi:hypothetical protein
MPFLPKLAFSRQDLLNLFVAIPLSVAGTGALLFLYELAGGPLPA